MCVKWARKVLISTFSDTGSAKNKRISPIRGVGLSLGELEYVAASNDKIRLDLVRHVPNVPRCASTIFYLRDNDSKHVSLAVSDLVLDNASSFAVQI